MKPPEAIAKLTAARVEIEPTYREQLLVEALSEDAVWHDAGDTYGRAAIGGKIGDELEDSCFFVSLSGRPAKLTEQWHFSWRVISSNAGDDPQTVAVRRQHVMATATSDGKLSEIVSHAPTIAPESTWRRTAKRLSGNIIAMVAVAAGVAYALLRIPLSVFYNELGVTPEQVGFGTDQLVKQSAGMFALIIIGGLVLGFAFHAYLQPWLQGMMIAGRLAATGQRNRAWAVGAILCSPSLLFIGWVVLVTHAPFDQTLFLVTNVALLAALALIPYAARAVPGAEAARVLIADRTRRSNTVNQGRWLMVAYFSALALFVGLPIAARESARTVRDGGTVTTSWLPWKARAAELRWSKAARPIKLHNDCAHLRYLGNTDKRVVVYDTGFQRAFSIPEAEAVVVTTEKKCIPSLDIARAKRHLRSALALRFGPQYRRGYAKRITGCSRISLWRARCRVAWRMKAAAYSGQGKVWFTKQHHGPEFNYAWTIRGLSRHCAATRRGDCVKVYRVR